MSLLADMLGGLIPELESLPATYPFHARRSSPRGKLHDPHRHCSSARARASAVTVDAATLSSGDLCAACFGGSTASLQLTVLNAYDKVSLQRLRNRATVTFANPANLAAEEHLGDLDEFITFRAQARHTDDPFTAAVAGLVDRLVAARDTIAACPDRLLVAFAPWCVDEVRERLAGRLPPGCAGERIELAELLARVAPSRWLARPSGQTEIMRAVGVEGASGNFDDAVRHAVTNAVDLLMVRDTIGGSAPVFDEHASSRRAAEAGRVAAVAAPAIAAEFREVFASRFASPPALVVMSKWVAWLDTFSVWRFPGVVSRSAVRDGGAARRYWMIGPVDVVGDIAAVTSLAPSDSCSVAALDGVDMHAAVSMLDALADTEMSPAVVTRLVLELV